MRILGINVAELKIDEVIDQIKNNKKIWIATVNPEFVMTADRDNSFKNILEKTGLNVTDGIGLVWAREVLKSKNNKLIAGLLVGLEILQGKYEKEVVSGVELIDRLCAKAEREGKTVYFLGGWNERASKTAQFFVNKYPRLKVAGSQAENFDFETEVDYLFVAYGMKKQEEWIESNFGKLKVGVVMGVGRSFDYYSGELKRAPKWVRRMGFEWFYSLMMEPKRWKRQLVLPKFIWKILTN